jgi:hypothetical protein
MQRAVIFAVVLAWLPLLALAAPPPPAKSASAAAKAPQGTATTAGRLTAIAPADQYFGPFGMSPLSIRSTIGLLGREYHWRTISDRDLLRKALITENALRLWRDKYPADPWLAPTFYHLEQLYQAVQTDEARKHATAMLKDVIRNYPNTKEAHLSRSRLAAGFPPLVAETPLVSPPPAAAPSALPAAATDTTASAGGASPAPSAAPSEMPVSAPEPSSSPNR